MNAVIILFAVGIVLLGIEVFAPGAIFGIMGGLAMLAGCIIAFQLFGVAGGLIAILVAFLLLGLALYLELVVLPKSSLGKSILVSSPTQAPAADEAKQFAGRTGVTETMLAPSGYVVIDGARYEALSESGLIVKGASVRVVSGDVFRLIVTSTNKQI